MILKKQEKSLFFTFSTFFHNSKPHKDITAIWFTLTLAFSISRSRLIGVISAKAWAGFFKDNLQREYGTIQRGPCFVVVWFGLHARPHPLLLSVSWARICNVAQESIPPAYVAWRAGTTTIFLLGSYPPSIVIKISSTGPATHRKTEKERHHADGRGGGGGGSGAESYDRKKAWPSINPSIVSVFNSPHLSLPMLCFSSPGPSPPLWGTFARGFPSTCPIWSETKAKPPGSFPLLFSPLECGSRGAWIHPSL